LKRVWLILALAALLAACETTTAPRRQTLWLSTQEAGLGDVDRLLQYHQRVAALKGAELAREYDWVRLEFEKEATDVRRVQLAMMLSIPGTAFRDDAAAIGLLQPILKDRRQPVSNLRPLAQLLQGHILELRRVDDALQTQAAKLRDEQRRAEALQQKLEALLEMEMKMIEREQSAQPKRR
jgi:hypothetical protein